MQKPTLSVILPNYNHAKFLEQNLDNILNQSYAADEILILDDASVDNSAEVIQRFARRDARIKFFQNEKNQGAVRSLSRLLERASGEYVYGASADDIVLPGFFEKCMTLLQRHPQASLCCGPPSSICGVSNQIWEYRNNWGNQPRFFSPEDLAQTIFYSEVRAGIPAHAIWKKKEFLEAGGYRPDLSYASDWFPLQVMAFRHGICYVPDPLALFRVVPSSLSKDGTAFGESQSKVFNAMLALMRDPRFKDIYSLFRRANIFRQWSPGIVETVVRNPEHWDPEILGLIEPLLLTESERLLADPSPAVRTGMVICLGKLGWRGTKIMLTLAEATKDREQGVRATAKLALDQHRRGLLWRVPGIIPLLSWSIRARHGAALAWQKTKSKSRSLIRNLCAKVYRKINYKLYNRIQDLENRCTQKDAYLENRLESLTHWVHQLCDANKELVKIENSRQARLVKKLKTLIEALERLEKSSQERRHLNGVASNGK